MNKARITNNFLISLIRLPQKKRPWDLLPAGCEPRRLQRPNGPSSAASARTGQSTTLAMLEPAGRSPLQRRVRRRGGRRDALPTSRRNGGKCAGYGLRCGRERLGSARDESPPSRPAGNGPTHRRRYEASRDALPRWVWSRRLIRRSRVPARALPCEMTRAGDSKRRASTERSRWNSPEP